VWTHTDTIYCTFFFLYLFANRGDEFADMLAATDDFCATVLSLVQATGNQAWPFVVVPDFAVHAAKAIGLSDAFLIAIHPVVNASQFGTWANYTSQNNAWLYVSLGQLDQNRAPTNLTLSLLSVLTFIQ
jgi:hypothetical protein